MGEIETIGQMLVRKPRGWGETLGTTASRMDDNINAMLQKKGCQDSKSMRIQRSLVPASCKRGNER